MRMNEQTQAFVFYLAGANSIFYPVKNYLTTAILERIKILALFAN